MIFIGLKPVPHINGCYQMKHGRKVEVKVEVINPKTIKITPVKSYNNGEPIIYSIILR